jgi:hypothetical protein
MPKTYTPVNDYYKALANIWYSTATMPLNEYLQTVKISDNLKVRKQK